MQEEERKEISVLDRNIKLLSAISGNIVAPFLGLLVAGPIGGVAGGIVGTIIKYGTEEFLNRYLTPREVRRVGTSAEFIIEEINTRLIKGDMPKEEFFKPNAYGSSDAEELFEGILLKCKNEYQEKKLQFTSSIFINASFDSNVSAITANEILSIAESLTYQRLCILSFFGRVQDEYDPTLLMKEPYTWYREAKYSIETSMLKQDIAELVSRGLIVNTSAMFSNNDLIPSTCTLSEIGKIVYESMDLAKVDKNDIDPIYEGLKYKPEFGLSEYGLKNGDPQKD